MPNAKMSMISLSASKTFLAMHLLNDCSDGKVELSKVSNWSISRTSFVNSTLPTFMTSLLL
jgi:hypothetical protein